MVCRRPNTKTLHLVKQGSAFSSRVWAAAPRGISELPNWHAGKQRGSLYAPYLPASDSQSLAPATRISRVGPGSKMPSLERMDARARCSFCSSRMLTGPVVANQGRAWFSSGMVSIVFVHGVCETVERSVPRAREYQLSFRVAAEDKSEKHSGGSTNLRGIRGRETICFQVLVSCSNDAKHRPRVVRVLAHGPQNSRSWSTRSSLG